MAFLSLFRKNRPQPNPTESDLEAAKRAADESFKMYGRKIGRGVTAFGNTPQNPRIRYNTPAQEAALPQPGMAPKGAENLPPSEQNPLRTLSIEGQARSNAAPLGTSSRWASMADFYNPNRPSPYGATTDSGTGWVRDLTAGEYAASIGRGSRPGIARFNRNQDQVQAERMFNAGQDAMVKATENQAMGQMFRSLNTGGNVKVVPPGSTAVDANGQPIYTAPGKQQEIDKDILNKIGELEREKQAIRDSGDLTGYRGIDMIRRWRGKQTRQQEIDAIDGQIAALRGGSLEAEQPTLKPAYATAEELMAALLAGKITPEEADRIAAAKGW